MSISQNLEAIRSQIPENVRLIAVSKTQPVEIIKKAYDAGHRHFGENRVQEVAPKYEALPHDIHWHLIGHLQTNKVKYIAPFVHLIHSVDRLKLLEEIDRQAGRSNRIIDCLLQVHVAREESKHGFAPDELRRLVHEASWSSYPNVRIVGLMGMATFTDDEEVVRGEFRSLKMLFDELARGPLPAMVEMKELSMGMSGDYRIAIEEGSTMVRIGTAIFGDRNSR